MFDEIIRSFRVENGLSQNMFVEMLQKSSKNFHNLDTVTLSRWERGVTKPHLSRQNELLDLIGADIFDIWENETLEHSLKLLLNRVSCNGYINQNTDDKIEIIRINHNNSYILNDYINEIELIINYERNLFFDILLNKELSSRAIFEKIINQYSGEFTLTFIHGHLVGHLLSSSPLIVSMLSDSLSEYVELDSHLIISHNVTHLSAVVPTIGREIYKYLHRLNPNKKLYLFLENKRMFDILFNLGFKYNTIKYDNDSCKIMNIDSEILKSKRYWMTIISKYKSE